MRVLQIIHGYPPYYMAGSEVYTYNLSNELTKYAEVYVFTRMENPYENAYSHLDEVINEVKIRRINKPLRDYTLEDKYLDLKMDAALRKYIQRIHPDVVHIGHLSHLSTNIINVIKDEFDLPVIYTLHDFWLRCIRGQAIKENLDLCPNPEHEMCYQCLRAKFKHCVTRERYMEYVNHMNRIIKKIDYFLSPSKYLMKYFIRNGVDESKISYSKYGFDKNIIEYQKKHYSGDENISFGFMGRVIPVKGIKMMLEAFWNTKGANLIIYGNSQLDKSFLEKYANENVHFKGCYNNWEIQTVLDDMDVLIVPSVWYENSPLVIQEAFLAGVPVITSDIGGMKELVEDGNDGFLFNVGNSDSLRKVLQGIISNPTVLNELEIRPSKVRSIEDDARSVMKLYEKVMK